MNILCLRALQILCLIAAGAFLYLIFLYKPNSALDVETEESEDYSTVSADLDSEAPVSLGSQRDTSDKPKPLELTDLNKNFQSVILSEAEILKYLRLVAESNVGTSSSDRSWRSLKRRLERQLFTRYAEIAPLNAMNYIDQSGLSVSLKSVVLRGWAKVDPEAALDWASHNHLPRSDSRVGFEYINWAQGASLSQSSMVIGLIQGTEDIELKLQLLDGFQSGMSQTRKYEEAFDHLLSLEDPVHAFSAVRSLLQQWLRRGDKDGAFEYMSNVPKDSILFMEGASVILRNLAKESRSEALAWADTFDEENRDAAYEVVVNAWSRDSEASHAEIFDWIESKGIASEILYETVIENWSRAKIGDYMEMLEWINKSDLSPISKDESIADIVDASRRLEDPFLSMELSGLIFDEEIKSKAQEPFLAQWKKQMAMPLVKDLLAETKDQKILASAAAMATFTNPTQAIELSLRITDEPQRSALQNKIIRYWEENDPEIYEEILTALTENE